MAGILPPITFLGAGSMAGAILAGLLQPSVERTGRIRVTNRSRANAERFAGIDAVDAIALEDTPDGNRVAVAGAKLVVVAVKPAMVPDLLSEISAALEPDAVVVSVAAGVTIATMEGLLPESVAVIRTMPNTPARVGRGVTGISAGTRATDDDIALVEQLFSTVGSTLVLDESNIDALSTISGSGPAYVFYLIEQLEAAALALGFSAADAALMVRETFAGSLALLEASGEEPRELRRQVTSPNGTTERAIATFDADDLAATFRAATAAALARARELAAGS
ncbi:MAG: pyrroline-5-carboxylate reductase [Agromyces sp.]